MLLVRRSPRHQRLSHSHPVFPLLPPDPQPGLPIHSMHTLVVHMLSRAAQQNMQPPIPEARFLPRQLHPSRNRESNRVSSFVLRLEHINSQGGREGCCFTAKN